MGVGTDIYPTPWPWIKNAKLLLRLSLIQPDPRPSRGRGRWWWWIYRRRRRRMFPGIEQEEYDEEEEGEWWWKGWTCKHDEVAWYWGLWVLQSYAGMYDHKLSHACFSISIYISIDRQKHERNDGHGMSYTPSRGFLFTYPQFPYLFSSLYPHMHLANLFLSQFIDIFCCYSSN